MSPYSVNVTCFLHRYSPYRVSQPAQNVESVQDRYIHSTRPMLSHETGTCGPIVSYY